MARYQLIDDYLVDIERRIRWRPDHAAAADELRDHLYSAVDDLLDEEEPTDADRWQAQQQVIARFGDPGTVATTFATTGSRGLAVPTTFTTSAGRLGVGSAGGWLAACGLFAASDLVDRATGDWDGAPQILFAIGTSVLLLTAALTTVVVAGLIRRHGGLGVVGWAAVVLAGLGAVASLLSWFVFGWVTLLGLGALTLSLAMARRSLAPRTATILFGTAWPVAAVVWAVLRLVEFGRRDEWGDYPDAVLVALVIGTVAFAAGLFGLGRWLAAEEPITTTATAPSAAG